MKKVKLNQLMDSKEVKEVMSRIEMDNLRAMHKEQIINLKEELERTYSEMILGIHSNTDIRIDSKNNGTDFGMEISFQTDYSDQDSNRCFEGRDQFNEDQFQIEQKQIEDAEELHRKQVEDNKVYLNKVVKQVKNEFKFKLKSCKDEIEDLIEKSDEEAVHYQIEQLYKLSDQIRSPSFTEAQNNFEINIYKRRLSACNEHINNLYKELGLHTQRHIEQEEVVSELRSKFEHLNEENLNLQAAITQFKKNEEDFQPKIHGLNEQMKKKAEEHHAKYAQITRIFDECFKKLMKDLEDSKSLHSKDVLDLNAAIDRLTTVITQLKSELKTAKSSGRKESDELINNRCGQLEENVPSAENVSGMSNRNKVLWNLLKTLKATKSHIKQSLHPENGTWLGEASSNDNLENVTCTILSGILQGTLREIVELIESFQPTENIKLESMKRLMAKTTLNVKRTNMQDEDKLKSTCSRVDKDSQCSDVTCSVVSKVLPEAMDHRKLFPNLQNEQFPTDSRVLDCSYSRLQTLHVISSRRSFGSRTNNFTVRNELPSLQFPTNSSYEPPPQTLPVYDQSEHLLNPRDQQAGEYKDSNTAEDGQDQDLKQE